MLALKRDLVSVVVEFRDLHRRVSHYRSQAFPSRLFGCELLRGSYFFDARLLGGRPAIRLVQYHAV